MKTNMAYFAVVLIWATTPLAIQWSGNEDWFFGLAGRIFISAVLIIPLLFILARQPFSLKWPAVRVYLAASLGMLGGMTPIYYAAQTMPSGWISLIFGLTPLMVGIMAIFLLQKSHFSFAKLIGILLSFSGLVVILLPQITGHQDGDFQLDKSQLLMGTLLALMGVFFHSLSTIFVKKYNHNIPNTHIVAATVWLSSVVYLIAEPRLLESAQGISLKAWLSILYLGAIGSVVGFILYYYVLKRMDAIKLGLIPLITPLMALLLGYFFNNEPLNQVIIVGAMLIILGLILFEFGLKGLLKPLQWRRKNAQPPSD